MTATSQPDRDTPKPLSVEGKLRKYDRRPFPSDHQIVRWCVSLTDVQWAWIEPLLPDRTPKRGGRWRDHRQVIDAVAWKYRTGSPWMDLPAELGSWKGAHNRLRMWAADGTWERVFTTLLAQADTESDLDWVAAVHSSLARRRSTQLGPIKDKSQPASRTVMPSNAPTADRPPRSASLPTDALAR